MNRFHFNFKNLPLSQNEHLEETIFPFSFLSSGKDNRAKTVEQMKVMERANDEAPTKG